MASIPSVCLLLGSQRYPRSVSASVIPAFSRAALQISAEPRLVAVSQVNTSLAREA